jgi:mannosyltransferase
VPGVPHGRDEVARAHRGFVAGVAAITGGVAAFLLLRLDALPPHEDETLAFFVSRRSLGDLLGIVIGERGGAPLHYLLGHLMLQLDPSLTSLRLVSVAFAVASMPLVAVLAARLADRRTALLATLLTAVSWVTLYHGIYARMYSLFLFTSTLSIVLLLRALERDTVGRWVAWSAATLALLATQPYGALVLAAQVVYVGALRLRRPVPLRNALVALVAVVVLAGPLWRTYLLLASRFEVGLGERNGSSLGSPVDVVEYVWAVMGDYVGGWDWVTAIVAAVGLLGLVVLARTRPESAILAGCVAGVPLVAFVAARSGAGAALETRHLIFVLPFFMTALVLGLERLTRSAGRLSAAALAAAIALVLAAQITWGLHRTPWLYEGEPDARTRARAEAAAWLAATSRPDDVLFGYEPTYLDAREKGAPFGDIFIPRADPNLALEALEDAGAPLGRGVWVLDASDQLDTDLVRLSVPELSPGPGFEARAFGPFLVVRTRSPTGTVENYLEETLRVQELSAELGIGDAGRNRVTAEEALRRLLSSP